jgi:predicted signal transduction protein with EAL and GGDEF domain
MEEIVESNEPADSDLVDPKVNIRMLLAVFWICHFILWIFGDMFSQLQGMGEAVTDSLVLFVAPTTAIVLTLMVVFCLVGRPTYVRLANLIMAPVYLLLNIVFFVDATQGWEYYLGVFYVLFNVLIIWHAYRWPTNQ